MCINISYKVFFLNSVIDKFYACYWFGIDSHFIFFYILRSITFYISAMNPVKHSLYIPLFAFLLSFPFLFILFLIAFVVFVCSILFGFLILQVLHLFISIFTFFTYIWAQSSSIYFLSRFSFRRFLLYWLSLFQPSNSIFFYLLDLVLYTFVKLFPFGITLPNNCNCLLQIAYHLGALPGF